KLACTWTCAPSRSTFHMSRRWFDPSTIERATKPFEQISNLCVMRRKQQKQRKEQLVEDHSKLTWGCMWEPCK
ncbi:MAG: hypothetical protein K2Z81_18655, partial [Cyanobacteria bacterium]|nr:hypothetical protein [Cyanobacteriota bacterium]